MSQFVIEQQKRLGITEVSYTIVFLTSCLQVVVCLSVVEVEGVVTVVGNYGKTERSISMALHPQIAGKNVIACDL